ncbi:hypothetical protein ACFB49_40730 [Sphingomonas sp. DBB INV C78]|uniref:acyltransferase family protein n=1 Tax=Sphingomonas sp. DBB INV C78 TaxID=3349434 RepID=UPI0036D43EA3
MVFAGELLSRHRKIDDDVSPQLDTLRGMSAIAVLCGHANQIFIAPVESALYPVMGLMAQAAVMLFFVLSGFLITKSITRNFSSGAGFDIRAYAADRFDRIYPPLLFALLIVAGLHAGAPLVFPTGSEMFELQGGFVVRDGFEVGLANFVGALFFLNGFTIDNIAANGPLWSLSYEVWYYVAAGLIAWRTKYGVFIAGALLVALGSTNKMFLAFAPIWFAGGIVALMHNWRQQFPRAASVVGGVLFLGVAWCAGGYIWAFQQVTVPAEINALYIVIFNLLFGLAAACALHLLLIGAWSVSSRPRHAANFSYTLYVTHFPIMLFIYGAAQVQIHSSVSISIAAALIAIASCLGVAIISAPLIETRRPLNSLGRRLRVG